MGAWRAWRRRRRALGDVRRGRVDNLRLNSLMFLYGNGD